MKNSQSWHNSLRDDVLIAVLRLIKKSATYLGVGMRYIRLSLAMMITITLLTSTTTFAKGDVFPFDNVNQGQRFHTLTQEIRCLVCQNQSISESNASVALDLKREVYAKIRMGVTDAAIKNDLVKRYGDFVLFKPQFSGHTFFLWFAPVGFILLGIALIATNRRQRARVKPTVDHL